MAATCGNGNVDLDKLLNDERKVKRRHLRSAPKNNSWLYAYALCLPCNSLQCTGWLVKRGTYTLYVGQAIGQFVEQIDHSYPVKGDDVERLNTSDSFQHIDVINVQIKI